MAEYHQKGYFTTADGLKSTNLAAKKETSKLSQRSDKPRTMQIPEAARIEAARNNAIQAPSSFADKDQATNTAGPQHPFLLETIASLTDKVNELNERVLKLESNAWQTISKSR